MTDTATPPQPAPVDHERATRLAGIVKDWRPIKDDPDMGNLARAYLAKCAEVEGLTTRLQKEMQDHMAIESKICDRAEAAEASAVEALEALEWWIRQGPHDLGCEWQLNQPIEKCTCGLAAAKGETV